METRNKQKRYKEDKKRENWLSMKLDEQLCAVTELTSFSNVKLKKCRDFTHFEVLKS